MSGVSAGAERAIRVLVSGVVLGQPMGGVRRHNAELLPRVARLLEQRGGSLAILEGNEPIAFSVPATIERIPSQVPARPPLVRALREGRELERVLAEARARGKPYDLVHLAHFPAPRALSTPFTLTVHDLRALELEHTPFSRRFFARSVLGRAFARAALVFTVSETVRAKLVTLFRLPPEKVALVSNAADHFEPLPRAPAPDAPLLHVGHLEPRKNLALLVEALALDPTLPHLWLAGAAKGEEQARLEALARERGVIDRIRFLGAVPDTELPRLYAACACVVLPSHLEGFGIPALEAQRARAPLAISSAGALPEIAGEDVPSFAPDDAAACARSIRAAQLESAEIRERRRRESERFSWDRSARAWVDGWMNAVRAVQRPLG
jgi:glycosyltransferase involved in cell wall biosynthesis